MQVWTWNTPSEVPNSRVKKKFPVCLAFIKMKCVKLCYTEQAIVAVFYLFLIAVEVDVSNGYCPGGWIKHKKKCYLALPPKVRPIKEAAVGCREQGGTLMNVYTEEINNMGTVLLKSVGADGGFIGLNDREEEGVWRWTDGTPVKYTSWSKGEPNNFETGEDCAEMTNSGKWNDVACDSIKENRPEAVLCEKLVEEHIIVTPRKSQGCRRK